MSDHDDAMPPSPPAGPPTDPPAAPPAGATPPPPPEPAPAPASGGGNVSENRTIMIVLAYLWILALIPLLVEKEDQEVQWHAKHGLVLAGVELVLWVVIMLLNTMTGFLGCILAPLYFLLWLAILGLHIACIVKGTKGERLMIPGISEYANRF